MQEEQQQQKPAQPLHHSSNGGPTAIATETKKTNNKAGKWTPPAAATNYSNPLANGGRTRSFPSSSRMLRVPTACSTIRQPLMAKCVYIAVFLKKKPNAIEPTDREMDQVVAVVGATRVVGEQEAGEAFARQLKIEEQGILIAPWKQR